MAEGFAVCSVPCGVEGSMGLRGCPSREQESLVLARRASIGRNAQRSGDGPRRLAVCLAAAWLPAARPPARRPAAPSISSTQHPAPGVKHRVQASSSLRGRSTQRLVRVPARLASIPEYPWPIGEGAQNREPVPQMPRAVDRFLSTARSPTSPPQADGDGHGSPARGGRAIRPRIAARYSTGHGSTCAPVVTRFRQWGCAARRPAISRQERQGLAWRRPGAHHNARTPRRLDASTHRRFDHRRRPMLPRAWPAVGSTRRARVAATSARRCVMANRSATPWRR